LPLTLELVQSGVLDLPEAIRKLTYNPAKILGVQGGCLEIGENADLALIDPKYEFELGEEDILSRSKNSPWIGKTLKGINELTMVGGKIVWKKNA